MKKNLFRPSTRRTFLCRLGRFASASPLAALATGSMAWMANTLGQEQTAIPKALFIHSPGGTAAGLWDPIGCETSYRMNSLSDPLESVKYSCSFIAKVHAATGIIHQEAQRSLTNNYTHPTLDRYLGKALGKGFPYEHVALGVAPISEGYFSNDPTDPKAYLDDPQQAFEALFGGDARTLSMETKSHLKVLDINRLQLKKMEASFVGEDRMFIQQRLHEVEQLAQQLTAPEDGSSACESPLWSFDADRHDFVANAKAQIDLAVLALKCGLTPVVSLQLGDHDGDGIYLPESGVNMDLRMSYENGQLQDYLLMRREMVRLVAYAIAQLGDTKTVNGARLLDETMMLHVTSGGDAIAHDQQNSPYFFAGGALGRLAMGKNINGPHYTNMDVIDTAAVAMGIDIDNSGYLRVGTKVVEEVLVSR